MKANSIFFRGAVGIAVAATCGYAGAASISGPTDFERVTAQKVADATDLGGAITIGTLNVTLGAAYSANGRVTLTLGNAKFHDTPSSTTCRSGSDANMTLTRESGGAAGDSSVTYLVNGVSAGSDTIGDVCSFGAATFQLQTKSLPASGDVTIQFSATNNLNSAIDTAAGASAKLASVQPQFTFGTTVGAFDGVIDVREDRLKFVDLDNAAGTSIAAVSGSGIYAADRLSFNIKSISLSSTNSATAQTFETTISGDFSWTKEPGEATCSATSVTGGNARVVASAFGITGATSVVGGADCNSVIVKVLPTAIRAASNSANDVTINVSVSAIKDLTAVSPTTANTAAFVPVTAFNGTATAFNYGSSLRQQTVANFAAGTWTTNGTVIDVPYMPFGQVGPAISHVMTINNRAATGGAVKVSAWRAQFTTGGVTYAAAACGNQNYALSDIGAQTVKAYTDEVTAYIRNVCGWTQQTRVALRFDVATPTAATELYSSFTIDGTRSNVVVNSSNGRGTTTR